MGKSGTSEELYLSGTSVSEGISFGKALHISAIDLDSLISFRHEIPDPDNEISRFENAVALSEEQIVRLKDDCPQDIAGIFDAQLLMIRDPSTTEPVIKGIRRYRINCESIIARQLHRISTRFENIENDAHKARALDVQDVYHRILANLLEIDHVRTNPLKDIPPHTVLVSERLLPSDIIYLNTSNISAIITETGSSVSHAAILARTLHIPYIVGIQGASTIIRMNETVLVDGNSGTVVTNPSKATLRKYTVSSMPSNREHMRYGKCSTADHIPIDLLANISTPDDVLPAFESGAEGIGLFRTEFIYLRQKVMPSVEEETEHYRLVLEKCAGYPVSLRLFDFGGDKLPVFPLHGKVSRTSFGIRGIRYLLENRALLVRQLTCIATAYHSTGTPFDLLIPFVTTKDELLEARSIIDETFVSSDIGTEAYSLGIMLEVPSAFFALEDLLPHVEFISIGTNDLIQYIFAFDREDQTRGLTNARISAVLSGIIRQCVILCRNHGKRISVCGEMASNADTVPELLSAGIRSLSVNTGQLTRIRSVIAGCDLSGK